MIYEKGRYFWAAAGSAIFLAITIPPYKWARNHANKTSALKLYENPELLDGVKREHLPEGILYHLERLENANKDQ